MSIACQEHAAPRVISDRKLAANRLNARKSTGPRTPTGKRRSAQNALKHGLCSTSPLLPNESEPTHAVFLQELKDELQPRTVLQRHLFPHIANLLWKLQRLPDAERHLFALEAAKAAPDPSPIPDASRPHSDSPPSLAPCQTLAHRFSDDPNNGFILLSRYERHLQNALLRLLRQYHALQKTHPTTPYAPDEPPVPRERAWPFPPTPEELASSRPTPSTPAQSETSPQPTTPPTPPFPPTNPPLTPKNPSGTPKTAICSSPTPARPSETNPPPPYSPLPHSLFPHSPHPLPTIDRPAAPNYPATDVAVGPQPSKGNRARNSNVVVLPNSG